MARLDALPSIDIIRGFKGTLDFYVWKGLPCVRAWPKYRPAKQTAASLAAALVFGAIVKSYSLLGDVPLEAYRADALDQPRTARDIMVTGVYGNLHEASMSDFLTLLTQCRDFLSTLTTLLGALDSVDTDELVVNVDQSVLPAGASTLAQQQIHTTALQSIQNLVGALHDVGVDELDTNVVSSALPTDAATSAAQASALTALQKIADLQDALESKALDRLLVRGMDQLFSLQGVLVHHTSAIISGADGWIACTAAPPDQYWIVTTIAAYDATRDVAEIRYLNRHLAINHFIDVNYNLPAGQNLIAWAGHTIVAPTDTIRAYFIGAQAGDTCVLDITGFRMTVET